MFFSHPWWGGVFLMPELQPIYDFETNDFSLWLGVELGKILGPGENRLYQTRLGY
jgi:hypothetical protein